jgi:5-formyltetrahydrofolate cyclo-ligase
MKVSRKQNFRNSINSQLIRLNSKNSNNLSNIIIENIQNILQKNSILTLGLYYPFKSEANIYRIISDNSKTDNTFAYPRISSDSLLYYKITSNNDVHKGRYKIMEPNEHCPMISSDKLDAILVPGLAFDRRGFRLGRGKGYYDRFLSTYKGISIGVCYSFQLFDEIPIEKHDQKVDMIVTEKEVLPITFALND